jgi:hypothetical protein
MLGRHLRHLLLGVLLGGCAVRPEPVVASGPPSASAIETCAASAMLYPRERMSDSGTRDAVIGKHWARRDGGSGSMHGPPELWRRSTDLRLMPSDGVIRMTYERFLESSRAEPVRTTITKDCQICGDVLVCEQSVWALATRTNDPPDGSPLDVLAMDAAIALDDHDIYLIRHGHEVYLDFKADPRTTATGALEIRVRRLERGAPVITRATSFVVEATRVRIELPDLEGIGLEFRPGRPPEGGGYGTDTTLEPSLYEMESLKRNPQLMDQPASLEIAADAPGFNLPHN